MYEWAKALHVIAVISWMAGMLYLPRLFVYHCDAEIGSKQSETFKVMERRLLKAIINPAMASPGSSACISPGPVTGSARAGFTPN
jgi:putative membrane protein